MESLSFLISFKTIEKIYIKHRGGIVQGVPGKYSVVRGGARILNKTSFRCKEKGFNVGGRAGGHGRREMPPADQVPAGPDRPKSPWNGSLPSAFPGLESARYWRPRRSGTAHVPAACRI